MVASQEGLSSIMIMMMMILLVVGYLIAEEDIFIRRNINAT
jgi:hypothetical protein